MKSVLSLRFKIMIERYRTHCFGWFHLVLIFIITHVLSYPKFECPTRTEWKFIAGSRCNMSEGYHCLYDENSFGFEEFCDTRSYNDPAGHKLVFVGNLDRKECEAARYQPFSFSTNGMSSCIFEKTYCGEEGQVIYSDGTTKSDRKCRCDYTRSYDFITKPKHSCYCVSSREDCSCYLKPCPVGFIMTPDYECINTTMLTVMFTCPLILSNGDKESKPTTSYIPINKEIEDKVYEPSNEYKTVLMVLVVTTVLCMLVVLMTLIFRIGSSVEKTNGYTDFEYIIRENLELRNRFDNPIPHNIKELLNYEKDQWKKRLLRFVKTKAYQRIFESVMKDRCSMISGPPGCGKSSLAFNAALALEETEGFELLIVTNPDDIVRYASTDKKQIFIIDDIYGKNSVNDYDIMCWTRIENLILTLLERNKNLKILTTCRSYLYNSVDIETVKTIFVHHSLLSEELNLCEDDRWAIGKSYLCADVLEQLDNEIIMAYPFFPELCVNYSADATGNILEYFSTPYSYVATEIIKMKEVKDMNYFSLAYLVILNNSVIKDICTQDDRQYDEILQYLTKEIGYSQTPSRKSLLSNLMTLIGSFVTEKESVICFLNATLFHIIAHCMRKNIIRSLFKFGSLLFLKDSVQFESLGGHPPELTILIPKMLETAYFDRIFVDIKKTFFRDVFMAMQNAYPKFREAFILHMRNKLTRRDLKDDRDGSSVVHVVASQGYTDYTGFFTDLDKSLVNKRDKSGQFPLHIACLKGHHAVGKLLLERNAFYDKEDLDGCTPLDLACAHGYTDTVQLLLSHGARIKQTMKNFRTALHVVCKNGFKNIADILIEKGAKINIRDKNGYTPLHLASRKGHVDIVTLLIEKDADINIMDNKGRTAVFLACEKKQTAVIMLLLKQNADMYISNADGLIPLHCSCETGSIEITNLLLEKSSDFRYIDIRDKKDNTPLHFACKSGNAEIVNMLLKRNANAALCNEFKDTPLHTACSKGRVEVAKLLLEQRADVNCPNAYNLTPLHLACKGKHEDIVSLLMDHGAVVNAKDKKFLQTPLYLSCTMENENIVRILCKNGAQIDELNKYGMTPLYYCCENGNTALVKILLKHGANVNVSKADGLTPLLIACREGYTETVKTLLSFNASSNIADKDGCTPLYIACKEGRTEIVKVLLNVGANVNQADKDGLTPLHITVQSGNRDLTELLLKFASVSETDKYGQTPLFKAIKYNFREITELLLITGASVNISDRFNITPMKLALQSKNDEIINLCKMTRR